MELRPNPLTLPLPSLTARRADGELVSFVLPGIVHAIGNGLFAVRGHTQLLRAVGGEMNRERNSILRASARAQDALDVLRAVMGEPGLPPFQADILLKHLGEALVVPLRDRDLTGRVAISSRGTPVLVDGAALCQTLVELTRHAVEAIHDGFEGTLVYDLFRQSRTEREIGLRLSIERGPQQLPFSTDLRPAARAAVAILERHQATVEMAEDRAIELRLPSRGV